MDDCKLRVQRPVEAVAGIATEVLLERRGTGKREWKVLEGRAEIDGWTAERLARPDSIRVGLYAVQEDIVTSWREKKKKKKEEQEGGRTL